MVLLSVWTSFMYESYGMNILPQLWSTYIISFCSLHFGITRKSKQTDFLRYVYYLKLFAKYIIENILI